MAGEPEYRSRKFSPSEPEIVWRGPPAWDVRFVGSQSLLATAGPQNPLTLRDLTGVRPDWTVTYERPIPDGAYPAHHPWPYVFSRDGRQVAAGISSSSRSFRIWDVASGREQFAIDLDDRLLQQLGFSGDGKRLAVGWHGLWESYKDSLGMTIFEAATGAKRAELRINMPAAYRTPIVAVSADSETLAIRGKLDHVELWDLASARRRATFVARESTGNWGRSDFVFSPDGSSLSTILPDGSVSLWDAATGQQILRDVSAQAPTWERAGAQRFGHGPGGHPFAFSPDSKTLAVSQRDGAVHVWDIPSARRRSVLRAPAPPFERSGPVLFSSDGQYLAVAGEGAPRTRIDRLPAPLAGMLQKASDGGLPDAVGRLIVWELSGGSRRLVAQASGGFTALAFSADGSILAAARQEFFPDEALTKYGKTVYDVMLWSLRSSPATSKL
jgi:WD40 repeat protein